MSFDQEKSGDRLSVDEVPALYDNQDVAANKRGTAEDQHDMYRLGKKPELRRNFRFISIVGFMMILQATWESALLSNWYGLYNGGTAGCIWATIGTWICNAVANRTTGGQYHWVSEFAPASVQKPLSYIVGWMCCLGWVSGVPACGQMLYSLLEGMILITNPNANIEQLWQATLILFMWVLLIVAFNIFLAQQLPLAEGIILVIHVFGFFAFLILFWVMADHASAHDVFLQFYDGGEWGSNGLSTLVGLTTPLWCFIGPDAGAHMSEELNDASLVLPRAMMYATFFNGILGIIMLITFCFCITDINVIVNSSSDTPVIDVLYNVTGSQGGTIVMGCLLLVLLYFSSVTTVASASRQCWAFARDKGFPFSSWIEFVRPGWDIPINAILVVLGVSLVLSAINFGSDVALNAILSVSNAALIFSYLCSITCLRIKRLRGEPLLPRRWSLGWWGGPINDVAIGFLLISFVFSFFPIYPMPALVDMNWAILIFGVVFFVAGGHYLIRGRKVYVPPVSLIKKDS
ncbi:amino acid transporter [Rhizodiscina lignyota]|uniref:Amino acid transporter n=1 Tax=Rhizodiscina lignyota TaxID=1504668 RepID=A0A9P4I4A3_9PEZI|nr:amino acid transporter [Rhizodiscina lignyota]